MSDAAISTDVAGGDVVLVHHWVERGINDRDGQWAVVKVERTIQPNGHVAVVRRTIVAWRFARDLAASHAVSLDTAEAIKAADAETRAIEELGIGRRLEASS